MLYIEHIRKNNSHEEKQLVDIRGRQYMDSNRECDHRIQYLWNDSYNKKKIKRNKNLFLTFVDLERA